MQWDQNILMTEVMLKYGYSNQSYHPVKNITSGEGGSILTNNKKIYLKSKF